VRIAIVVTGGVDEGGRERVVPALLWQIERLARRHELTVYALRYHSEPRRYRLLGATVQDLGRPSGLIRQYRALSAAVRRDGPYELIHGWWAIPSGIVAVEVGRRLGIPSVVTCDSGEFAAIPEIDYGLQLRLRHRLAVRMATRRATRVLVCTRFQERLARARGVVPVVMPIGVDTGRFRPPGASTHVGASGERGIGPPWRLLHVASLNPVKDQTTLLHALGLLVNRHVDAHLDIVGEDTLHGGVQRLARELRLDGHVTFHPVTPTDELVPFYHRAHALVVSSRHEAAGVVALEAAACNLPVVGTAVGYVADWAPDRAVAVPTNDPAALANAIEALLRDAPRREQMSSAAREWTLAHDADWTAEQLDRLYCDLASP
jgi:glycosyltransferase involved in cell wall biosynthesis